MQGHKYRTRACSVYSSTLPGTRDVHLQGKHHSQLGRFVEEATYNHLKHTEALHRTQALCPVMQTPAGKNLMSSLCLHFLLVLPGNTNSIFALDYISGALTLNGPLDRENPFYSSGFILTVKVRCWKPPWSRMGEQPDGGTNPGTGASGGIHSCEPSLAGQRDLVQPL